MTTSATVQIPLENKPTAPILASLDAMSPMSPEDGNACERRGLDPQNQAHSEPSFEQPRKPLPAHAFTVEDHARSRAARTLKQAQRSDNSALFRDCGLNRDWCQVAVAYGVKLPLWGTPMTPAAMRRWLRKVGYDMRWFRDWFGRSKLQTFIIDNPTWPLRAWAGTLLLLREFDDKHGLPAVSA